MHRARLDSMATLRPRNGAAHYWKAVGGRPRYFLEVFSLFLAIGILFLAYRYYFGSSVNEAFDVKICGRPVAELCLLDRQSIENCKVTANCDALEQQIKDADVAKKTDTPVVLVEVFYEVLCPDSKDFIIDQIFPTVQKIGGIMNVSMVPYGKATERREKEEYIFTCQHGPNECKGNMIQTCAIVLLAAKDANLAISFIHCMEVSHDPSAAGPACSKDVGIDFKPIEACATGQLGNKLQHIMAQRTENLNPKLYWVPWVVVNGLHTKNIQDKATSDLHGLVCDTYQGPKPPGCESDKSSL